MAQNEARGWVVAEEMEKDIRSGVFDVEKVKAIAGESAAALKARRGITVSKFFLGWLDTRKNKRGAQGRADVSIRRFLDFPPFFQQETRQKTFFVFSLSYSC